jgi:hypothetical protein
MGIDKSTEEWASHSLGNESLSEGGVFERNGMLAHGAGIAKTEFVVFIAEDDDEWGEF